MEKARIENGMYKITGRQKDLLRDLDTAIIKIIGACEDDNIFNEFINTLGVFDWTSGDLIEISGILIDNYSKEMF